MSLRERKSIPHCNIATVDWRETLLGYERIWREIYSQYVEIGAAHKGRAWISSARYAYCAIRSAKLVPDKQSGDVMTRRRIPDDGPGDVPFKNSPF